MKWKPLLFVGICCSAIGCTGLDNTDAEISVGRFVDRVNDEMQYFYYLNATADDGSVGLCLASLEIGVITSLTQNDNKTLALTLETASEDTLGLTPNISGTALEVQNYRYRVIPDYEATTRNAAEKMADLDPDEFTFAQALMTLKQALLGSKGAFDDPDFGPRLAPSLLIVKFQLKITEVESGKLLISVLAGDELGKAVPSLIQTDTKVSDATATARFSRPSADGTCSGQKFTDEQRRVGTVENPRGDLF